MSDPMNDVDLRIALARLDERLKSLVNDIARTETHAANALKIASEELARRLDVLNHAHQQAEEARAQTVQRETFDVKVGELETDVEALKGDTREARGRMWLPMIIIAAMAAGLAAAAVSMIVGVR